MPSRVKGRYRKSTSGSEVKFDKDSRNDKSDGRSQGIRWAKKHIPDARVVTSIGMVRDLFLGGFVCGVCAAFIILAM